MDEYEESNAEKYSRYDAAVEVDVTQQHGACQAIPRILKYNTAELNVRRVRSIHRGRVG